MSTGLKVTAFVVGLAVVFGLALGLGRLVGADPAPEPVAHDDGHATQPDGHTEAEPEGDGHGGHGAEAQPAGDVPGGLMVAQDGFALELAEPTARAGRDVPVRFTVTGPDGAAVTAYDVEHEKRLHLIAVRRDLSGFQHVHPELDDSGVWATKLDLTPGQWRLFADFKATGAEALTLGADLDVPGRYRPVATDGETRTAQVDDYTVTLDGDLAPGADAKLALTVERDGEPVTDLEPYLGAYGHLVALRDGDLAYLHVHPDGTPGDGTTQPGPEVVFYAAVPSDGTYHLFLDFKHGGVVRTAAFRVGTGRASGEDAREDSHEH